jgi:2-phosphoglycerate kinase
MVILIGGVSCTGKTLMAQKLMERYKMPYLSLDHLKMGIFRGDPQCGFTPTSTDALIAEKLWPIVKGIIMTAIENKQHLILEGCYIMPRFLKELNKPYRDEILALFLGFSVQYIENNYTSGIIACRSIIEQRLYPEDRTVSQFIREHEAIKNECLENSATYYEIKRDYETEIAAVYEYIEENMR